MMLTYSAEATLICCAIILIYSVLYRGGKKIQGEDFVVALLLVCISGFRYGLGSDYFRYLESYGKAVHLFHDLRYLFSPAILKEWSYEVGYELLCVFTSRVSDSPYAIFWSTSLLMYVPLVWYCRKRTCSARAAIAVFLLFGFWGMSLNIVKQAVSMIFILLCYDALERKKYVQTFLALIAAFAFHSSAIVAFLLLLIVHTGFMKKWWMPTKKNLYFWTAIGVGMRFGTSVFIKIASHISFFSKYVHYLYADSTDNISRKYIMFGAFFETVFVFGLLYYAIQNLDWMRNTNPKIENIISLIMLGLPFSIIGISRTLWLANRFAKYLFLFLIVLIPEMVHKHPFRIRTKADSWLSRIVAVIYSAQKTDSKREIVLNPARALFWCMMVGWHVVYNLFLLDNNKFQIGTYLFGLSHIKGG